MAQPTLKVEISFAPTPAYPDNWQDVSTYVLEDGTDIQRGRSDEQEPMATGQATVTLFNNSRRFDPDNAASPYYPNVRPMQRIRISAVWSGTTYSLFVGYIVSWQAGRPVFGKATTVIQCVDALGAAFAQTTVPESLTLIDSVPFNGGIYEPLTNAFVGGPLIPMTSFGILSGTALPTSGTFRVSVYGSFTAPIAYNATIATLVAALEALPTVEENSLYVRVSTPSDVTYSDNVIDSENTIYFGGQYTGVDIRSAITVDVSQFLPINSRNVTVASNAPTSSVVPNVLQRVSGRSVEVSLNADAPSWYGPPTYGALSLLFLGAVEGTRGVYLDAAFLTAPGQIVTLTTNFAQIYSIVMYPLTTIPATYPAGSYRATVEIVNTAITSRLSGASFVQAARSAGWPELKFNADAGSSTVLDVEVAGATITSLFQSITTAEGGATFIGRDGLLTFKGRSSIAAGVTIATLGNPLLNATYLPYEAIETDYDDRYIRNSVTMTADGGDPQNVQDAASIERYYIRSYDQSGLIITTDQEALDRANYFLALYKEPKTRITSVSLRGDLNDTALWPIILAGELTQKYTVVYEPVAGVGIPKNVNLEQISIKIRRGDWLVDWSLSPRASVFVADVSLADGPDIVMY